MLTEQNCGKLLSDEYHKEFQDAIADPTQKTADELTYLGVSSDSPRHIKEQFQIEQDPVDCSETRLKTLDLHDLNRNPGVR